MGGEHGPQAMSFPCMLSQPHPSPPPFHQLAESVYYTRYKALYGITNCALVFPRTSLCFTPVPALEA